MKKITLLLFIALIGLMSCQKDKEEDSNISSTQDFKFVVEPDYFSEDYYYSKGWIMIYGQSNELLSFFELKNDTTFVAELNETTKNGTYKLHILFKNEVGSSSYYSLRAYTLASPRTYYINRANTTPTIYGTNEILLNNMDNSYNYIAQNRSHGIHLNNYEENTLNQYHVSENLWILKYIEGSMPYYKWYPEVDLNEDITLADSELIPMSDYSSIIFPNGNGAYVALYSADDISTEEDIESYNIYSISTENSSSIKYYYPNGIFNDFYYNIGTYNEEGSSYMIQNRGEHPTIFVTMDAANTVTNKSIYTFNSQFQSNSEVDFVRHTWSKIISDYNASTRLFYYAYMPASSELNYAAPPLPQDIIDMDPNLFELYDMEYNSTSVFDHSFHQNYSDYMNFIYQDNNPSEYYSQPYVYYYRYFYDNEEKRDLEMNLEEAARIMEYEGL